MNNFFHRSQIRWGLFAVIFLVFLFKPVNAQSGQQILISPPIISQFPEISLDFDVLDPAGNPKKDLDQEQFTILENGQQVKQVSFDQLTPGIQLVLAINNSPPLAIQDISGTSRLEYIKESLISFLNQTPAASPDDLSLISNDGLEITHQNDRSALIESLEDYNPDSKETTANFNVLSRAIEIASDPGSEPGMKRVVLLFSPAPTPQEIGAIADLSTQAASNQVIIYPIIISSPAFFDSEGVDAISKLASDTNGEIFLFSGAIAEEETEDEEDEPDPGPEPYENLPDFWLLLDQYRSTYRLQYRSQIITSGVHTLVIKVKDNLEETEKSLEFSLEVLPPNPILVSPPREIIRETSTLEGEEDNDQALYPQEIELEALIEFPDQLPREITESILRVDGEIAARNLSAPFDRFTWDLSPYQISGVHYLTLEVVDELGLSKSSVQTPVEVIIDTQAPSLKTILIENRGSFLGLAVLIAAGLGFLLLIFHGKIQPRSYPGMSRYFSNSPSSSEKSGRNKKDDKPSD